MLAAGDIIEFGVDVGKNDEKTKVLASIFLAYPHTNDSIIPSSIDPVEPVLDRTDSFDDLIEVFESKTEKTAYDNTSIEKLKLAKRKMQELGISHKEALLMVGY